MPSSATHGHQTYEHNEKPPLSAQVGLRIHLLRILRSQSATEKILDNPLFSAVAVAANLHLLAAMPDLPGAMEPVQPMLEYDTTPNRFREELLATPLSIPDQVKRNGGWVSLPQGPGLGIELDFDFMEKFEV